VRNLSLVVCGAPLASRFKDVVAALEAADWSVTVVPTTSAQPWLDREYAGGNFRLPEDPKPPRPDAMVVCPLTFNTGNKWIAGHADSRPLALLCESLGSGLPIVAVPFVNESLWGHPAWAANLGRLEDAGVALIDAAGGATPSPLRSGTGDEVTRAFDPAWIVAALTV
jgi:phosphopantothenoylcysteine synthetase/decarboxylase